MLLARHGGPTPQSAKPYCQCWKESRPTPCEDPKGCTCGEDSNICEWRWEMPNTTSSSWVMMCPEKKQVTFHPSPRSSGTAAVKGDTPLVHNYHYYWEVKMLTKTHGTDIEINNNYSYMHFEGCFDMVGVGTKNVDLMDSLYKFTSFLGRDGQSYGLSYTGRIRHDALVYWDNTGFCKGTIIGVRVNFWQGTLEYYLNRESQGISFYNLRRHTALYPMICSTVAQSSMRLIYASSWQASLLVDAAKILARLVHEDPSHGLPPGLRHKLNSQFWLTLRSEDSDLDDEDPYTYPDQYLKKSKSYKSLSCGMKKGRYFKSKTPSHSERDDAPFFFNGIEI